jgi:hypothetical protein
MKITRKQLDEVEFLSQIWVDKPFTPTAGEIEDYIHHTVHGGGIDTKDKFSSNRLRNAKQKMDLTIKMWIHDMYPPKFLKEDDMYNHPYGKKMIDSVTKRINDLVKIEITRLLELEKK